MKRKEPMKRGQGFKRKPGAKPLARSKFTAGLGRVGKLRQLGNLAARAFYFKHHGKDGLAPCQSCGVLLANDGTAQGHHKKQKGENIENKLVLCGNCHIGFVHDLNRREHRRAAEHSPANVVNGFRIDWKAYGLNEAFAAFKYGEPQPKGYVIPHGPNKGKSCQGCRETEGLLGTVAAKVWQPCLLHRTECHDGLFAPGEE